MSEQLKLFNAGQQHQPREYRLNQMYDILAREGGRGLPLRVISKRMGLSKSKHVSDLMAELVDSGVATWEWSETNNKLQVRLFSLVHDGGNNE